MDIPTPIPPPEALFNIGAVSRMTGVPIASLHAWERRYGFPHPSGRTAGGHRLYSEKDVELLRCVRAQIEQGISAHQAVLAVLKMEQEGRLPEGHPTTPARTAPFPPASPAGRSQLSEALYRHDLTRADQILADLLALASPEQLTLNVIGPVLADLGEAWQNGQITIADEHLISNYLRQRLLMWLVSGPPPRPVAPIVLACTPGEWHEGGLLMLGVLLRRRGWPVAYLGQNVPYPDLAAFVEKIQPSAVVLVGMLQETARSLAEWPKWIRQVNGRPLMAFAGRAFVMEPKLIGQVPGIYLGDSIQAGLAMLENSVDEK